MSVTDASNNSEWLGFWQRFNLTSSDWHRFEAPIPIALPSKRSHALDVAIIVGHAAATYHIDDVVVSQREPPGAAASISVDFEERGEDAPSTVRAVGTAQSPHDAAGGGGAAARAPLRADLASAAAAHSGGAGAELTVTEVVSPAWAARLELGTVTARLNTATISFGQGAAAVQPVRQPARRRRTVRVARLLAAAQPHGGVVVPLGQGAARGGSPGTRSSRRSS